MQGQEDDDEDPDDVGVAFIDLLARAAMAHRHVRAGLTLPLTGTVSATAQLHGSTVLFGVGAGTERSSLHGAAGCDLARAHYPVDTVRLGGRHGPVSGTLGYSIANNHKRAAAVLGPLRTPHGLLCTAIDANVSDRHISIAGNISLFVQQAQVSPYVECVAAACPDCINRC